MPMVPPVWMRSIFCIIFDIAFDRFEDGLNVWKRQNSWVFYQNRGTSTNSKDVLFARGLLLVQFVGVVCD